MMVIRGSLATTFAGIPQTQIQNFPADSCVWSQSYNSTTTEYQITGARFLDGSGNSAAISNPVLGYIGKSGRFVPISQ